MVSKQLPSPGGRYLHFGGGLTDGEVASVETFNDRVTLGGAGIGRVGDALGGGHWCDQHISIDIQGGVVGVGRR